MNGSNVEPVPDALTAREALHREAMWGLLNAGVEDAATRADELIDAYVRELTGTGHTYLSTGCLHGQHGYCANVDGVSGSKVPAQCKFCPAQCVCQCHQEPQ